MDRELEISWYVNKAKNMERTVVFGLFTSLQ